MYGGSWSFAFRLGVPAAEERLAVGLAFELRIRDVMLLYWERIVKKLVIEGEIES